MPAPVDQVQPQSPTPELSVPSRTASKKAPDNSRLACIEGFFGGTGTGKSTSIKQRLAGLRPPFVFFDPKHEYMPGYSGGTDEPAFLAAVDRMADAHAPAEFALLRPSFDGKLRRRQFERFCAVALAIARHTGHVVIVADELHLVTDAGNAPDSWLELIQTGRALGCHLIAASIRPQSIDMDFRSNLTYIRAFRLGEQADCERVASKLMIDWRELAGLPNFEFYERDMATGAPAVRGKVEKS